MATVESDASSATKALVFVSHDTRDADLAEAFGNLLTDASGGVLKSFRSSDRKGTDGIEFGVEWYPAIMRALAQATDVVALVTQQSIDRPWILYEAGVAKGKLDTTVFGVSLGVALDAARGPFAQFQNCGDDEDSLTKLVLQLIKRNPDAAPREEAVRRQVEVFRTTLSELLKKRSPAKPSAPAKQADAEVAKLFEEVKAMFASLPERLNEQANHRRRRKHAIHPLMFDEVIFHPAFERDHSGVGWLLFISAFREDLPWFYELGLPLYHALQRGDRTEVARASDALMRALHVVMRSPLAHAAEYDSFLLRELPLVIERSTHRLLGSIGPTPRKRPKREPSSE